MFERQAKLRGNDYLLRLPGQYVQRTGVADASGHSSSTPD